VIKVYQIVFEIGRGRIGVGGAGTGRVGAGAALVAALRQQGRHRVLLGHGHTAAQSTRLQRNKR